ncbi:MAG: DUF167 domain-containing protein [Acidimicrobiia bacterium]
MDWWRAGRDGVDVTVRAVPNARTSAVVGVDEAGRLRVRVAAPAVDGQANDELRRLIAHAFGVRRSAVHIVRGQQSRTKQLHVAGVDAPPAALLDRLPDPG